MAETVIVRQTKDYETKISALDTDKPDATAPQPIHEITDITPYGMVLAGIGTCTAFVVNTYAEHHGQKVDAVEIRLEYGRSFKEDCERCEEIDKYEDIIAMTVRFEGTLTKQEREKLFTISLRCPVHRMVKSGIKIVSTPAQTE